MYLLILLLILQRYLAMLPLVTKNLPISPRENEGTSNVRDKIIALSSVVVLKARPSEHPPVRGKNVKTFRWDHRLLKQNLFVAFKRVPLRMVGVTSGQQYNIGEKPPPLYCVHLLTLIAMQGHQKNSKNKNIVVHHQTW